MAFVKDYFTIAENCERKLWLELRRRAESGPKEVSPATQLVMRMGREVGLLAQKRFPRGLDCSRAGSNEDRAAHTLAIIESGSDTLFEPTFIAERCLVRCDILMRDELGWHLIEVKSKRSDRWKGEYVDDVAFQMEVVERSGIALASASLLFMNGDFVWNGSDIDAEALFTQVDITSKAQKLRPALWNRAQELLDVIEDASEPKRELKKECGRCDFRLKCYPELGVDSLVYMPKIKQKRLAQFLTTGYETIDQLSPDDLHSGEHNAWHCFSMDQGVVTTNVRRQLTELRFPITFLDFEFGGTAIPLFPGFRCWNNVVFQWSTHTLASADAVPIHEDFLHTERTDPSEIVVATLLPIVRRAGSVVVYSNAERTQVRALAERGVAGADELWELFQEKEFDLNALILEGVYFPGFRGLNSIKVVLPTLVPEMGYDSLEISGGEEAKNEWFRLVDEGTPPEERDLIAAHLREYCAMDTLAMVALFRRLLELEPTVAF